MFAIYFWSAVAALGIVGAMWVAEKLDPRFTKKQSAEGCEWCGQERNCGRCEQPLPCDVCAEDWIYPIYDLDDDGHWYISAWTCECS